MPVGQIAGLRRPDVAPRVEIEAVNRAFTLVSGWQKPDKGAITKALEQLRETAEHNQAVYDQAAKALNELSRRDKAARDAEAQLAALQTAFDLSRAEHARSAEKENRRLSDMARDLADERASFDAGRRAMQDGLDARERAQQQREAALQAREADLKARENAVKLASAAAERKAGEADAMVSKMRALVCPGG